MVMKEKNERTMTSISRCTIYLTFAIVLLTSHRIQAQEVATESLCLGTWAFELDDGYPAWLGVSKDGDVYSASLLWGIGSARPVKDLVVKGNEISFSRRVRWKYAGDAQKILVAESPIVGTVTDDQMTLQVPLKHMTSSDKSKSKSVEVFQLVGKRMPPLPKKPDLTKVRFGKPVKLFNEQDLSGWRLANPNKKNGWRAEKGELVNETPKTDFGGYGEFGNLVTNRTFEDFRLSIEYNVGPKSNSGIYLRGMYEAQVVDRESSMQGISGPGAIFGRIEPRKNAGKLGGAWNRYVLTLVDRHVSVELNGELVIDNQPLVGCTGGGLSADDTKPGPIFLQGDHTSVRYRNIVLEPVEQ